MTKKYSDWLKIDLHIHTNKSNETKHNDYSGTFDIHTLKSKLKEHDVKIFSLTDHNIINVQAYEEYLNSYNPNEDPLLLLGIELDIVVETNKTYHTLLVFRNNEIDYINDLSKRLEDKYIINGIGDKFARILSIDDIVEVFKSDDFFFIPHADKDGHKNIVSAYRENIPNLQRMVLLMHSALEKVTKFEMKQFYYDGFKRRLTDTFQRSIDIPYINFSDNHNCQRYPLYGQTNRDHSFYYVKGIKSFESIRLAFIDPSSRIKSEQEYNAIDRTITTIKSFEFKNNPYIVDAILEFSPHFNVIIGGRSSGKSLLLSLLGARISESLSKEAIKYGPIAKEGEILIQSNRDATPQAMTSLNQGVLYISQGEIANYFESENLQNLVYASDSVMSQEYINADLRFEKIKSEFSQTILDLSSSFKNVEDININNQIIIHSSDIALITDNENYILRVNTSRQAIDCEQRQQTMSDAHAKLVALTQQINLLNIPLHKDVFAWTEDEERIISEMKIMLDAKKEQLNFEIKRARRKSSFLILCNEIVMQKNKILDLNSQQKHAAITRKDKTIQETGERFVLLRNLKRRSLAVVRFNHALLHEIPLKSGITLIRKFECDCSAMDNLLLDCIKSAENTKSLFYNLFAVLQNRKTVKQYSSNKCSDLQKKIHNELTSFYQGCGGLKDFLQYENGETSQNSSPGLNSEKYMDVLFENPKFKTFLIDQPEDNLSHGYIAEGLVDKIRKYKYTKQFIVVTHNPSIVVYGDAECIILAKKDNNKITYQQLSLENNNSQKTICSTLDGGEYIFNNRSNKYNIRRVR